MSNSDKRLIYSFMRNLSKNQLHELKEFFPVGILKGVLLVVSSSRLSGNASSSALPALRLSLIGILTILSLNEKSPNVFAALGDFLY